MSKFYAKGFYHLDDLEHMTKDQWLNLPQRIRSDIRLALSGNLVYSNGKEKERIFKIRSKLIDYSMN